MSTPKIFAALEQLTQMDTALIPDVQAAQNIDQAIERIMSSARQNDIPVDVTALTNLLEKSAAGDLNTEMSDEALSGVSGGFPNMKGLLGVRLNFNSRM